jgi:flavorubredoxin
VANVLKKVAALTAPENGGRGLAALAPLHGPVLEGEKKDEALRLYTIWSAFDVETDGVLVAYASIHGNTRHAAEQLVDILKQKAEARQLNIKIAVTDLSRDDMAEAIEDAFRMNRLVLCCATYDADIFPPMHMFLHKLRSKGYQNRRVALMENGSWAPQAVRIMKEMLEGCKNIEIVEPTVTIRGALKPEQKAELEVLADKLLEI